MLCEKFDIFERFDIKRKEKKYYNIFCVQNFYVADTCCISVDSLCIEYLKGFDMYIEFDSLMIFSDVTSTSIYKPREYKSSSNLLTSQTFIFCLKASSREVSV